MSKADKLWAEARQKGQPTAGDKTTDGDMILIAQAISLSASDVAIATTNIGHLSRFITAQLWQKITLRNLHCRKAGKSLPFLTLWL